MEFISYLIWRWRAIGRVDKFLASQNYLELIEFCNNMISKNKSDHLAFYYRGLSNEALNLYENSILDFEQSQRLLNNYKRKSLTKEYFSLIPIQMSRVYRKILNNEKAFQYADKAVEADNDGGKGLTYRALLKADFEDNAGALEDLNQALKRRPADKTILKLREQVTYSLIEDQKQERIRSKQAEE